MFLKLPKSYLLIGFLLIFNGIHIFSQKNEKEYLRVDTIGEIVVTENSHNNEVRSTAPLQILTVKSIALLNSLQVSDVIKHLSGVTVKDYGGIGGLKTISVRGLGANHTAVNYDGIALSDIQTGQIDIGRFSLDNVQTISLASGQTDNIFQPARLFASASVLNIQTVIPEFRDSKNVNGKVSLKGGSFGLFNPSFLTNWKINNRFTTSFNGEWLSASGKYPFWLNYGTAGNDSLKIRENTDVANLRLEGTLHAKLTGKSSGYVKAYFYNSERGLPGAVILYNPTSFSSQRLWDNTFFTQAHYKNDFSEKWAVQANAKYNRSYTHYLDNNALNSTGKIENTYVQNEIYGSVSALFRAFPKISFSASSDFSINRLDADLVNFSYPIRNTWLTVLAGKYVSNHVLATASLLYTFANESVKLGTPAENRQRFSPYASISVKPFEAVDLRFRAFYKNIFRLPTFNDLYYSKIGNRNLKPENTDQFNLGTTYSLTTKSWLALFTFTADAYHNSINNKIVASPSTDLFEWSMVNYGKVTIDGLDVNFESLIKINNNIQLIAGSSYTYQKALDKTDPNSRTYNHQIPYTPRISGSGKAGVLSSLINVSYTVVWSGVRYSGFQNYASNHLSGYADHSISVSRDFSTKYLTIGTGLEILNFTNKNYEVIRYFPMPGRSFRGNISIKF